MLGRRMSGNRRGSCRPRGAARRSEVAIASKPPLHSHDTVSQLVRASPDVTKNATEDLGNVVPATLHTRHHSHPTRSVGSQILPGSPFYALPVHTAGQWGGRQSSSIFIQTSVDSAATGVARRERGVRTTGRPILELGKWLRAKGGQWQAPGPTNSHYQIPSNRFSLLTTRFSHLARK